MSGRPLKNATVQILLAISCGVLLGVWQPQLAVLMRPLSDLFIRIIGLLMPFMMFLLVVSGVAGLRSKDAGLAGKIVFYFQMMSLLSLSLGLLVALMLHPGTADVVQVTDGSLHGVVDPYNGLMASEVSWQEGASVMFRSLSQSLVLQVMLTGLLVGVVVGHTGKTGKVAIQLTEITLRFLFTCLKVILYFAPVAAFGAMAFTIGRFGPGSALPLLKFVAVMYLGCGLFVALVLALIARLSGTRLWQLTRYLKDDLLLVAFTGSSVAALPGLIEKLQKLGCEQQLVRLVLTSGYTFNLSGSNIYLSIAVVFLVQLSGIELAGAQVLTIFLVAILTSLGSTSMAGSALFTLIATISLLHIVPLESVGLLVGVERLMKCRSLTNVLGNCVACLAIARWQNTLDRPALRHALGQ